MKIYVTNSKKNAGIALPVILLLLLVMTILGVTSLSSSTLQERMTASQRLRTIAFNFAETTLRDGEAHAELIAPLIRKGLLTTEGGSSINFFATADSTPGWELGSPSLTVANPGDSCTGGYCTPLEFDSATVPATIERWLDASVWSDTEKHRVLDDLDADELADQDIAESPKYIIEFLGQLPVRTNLSDPDTAITTCATPTPANTSYPYCTTDPFFFRITARAIAGISGRQSVVTLQSTIIIE